MITLSNNLYQEEITENVGLIFALAVKLDISISDFAYIFASSSVAFKTSKFDTLVSNFFKKERVP